MNTPSDPDDTRYQLGVISGKLDLLLLQSAEAARRNEQRFAKIEEQIASTDARVDERLTSLEHGRTWVLGGAAAVSTAIGGVATWLGLR